jgi:hypothetical protein
MTEKEILNGNYTSEQQTDMLIDLYVMTGEKEKLKEINKIKFDNIKQKEAYEKMSEREKKVYDMNVFIRDCREANINYDVNIVKKLYGV